MVGAKRSVARRPPPAAPVVPRWPLAITPRNGPVRAPAAPGLASARDQAAARVRGCHWGRCRFRPPLRASAVASNGYRHGSHWAHGAQRLAKVCAGGRHSECLLCTNSGPYHEAWWHPPNSRSPFCVCRPTECCTEHNYCGRRPSGCSTQLTDCVASQLCRSSGVEAGISPWPST